jgi:hypothetical protein
MTKMVKSRRAGGKNSRITGMRPRAAGDFRFAAGFALATEGMAVVALTSVMGSLDYCSSRKNRRRHKGEAGAGWR